MSSDSLAIFQSDFFTYCTRLPPIERKYIGALSEVRHLDEGVEVFELGDESDALYIINRGAVEVVHTDNRSRAETVITYLSRGDVFGEMGVLTNAPRKNTIRTCEPVSLQVFKKSDFPALIEKVPSFFYYLSQQLAYRLVQVSDMAFIQSNCLELSGSLTNFDLVTIYQTILNSSQTGELSIYDEGKEPVATFFFQEGNPKWGQYLDLLGEEAFWQLFLNERQPGSFTFYISEDPETVESRGPVITRNPTDMLITALQYRDEFKLLSEMFPNPEAFCRRNQLNFEWPDEEYPELRGTAEEIWQFCYAKPQTFEALVQELPFAACRIYKVVGQLVQSGHFVVEDSVESTAMA